MESKSKFACLRIDDDSEEEFTPSSNGKGKNSKSSSSNSRVKTQNSANGPSKLIVHAVEKRPRNKPATKPRVIDPESGLYVQDADSFCGKSIVREEVVNPLPPKTNAYEFDASEDNLVTERVLISNAQEEEPHILNKSLGEDEIRHVVNQNVKENSEAQNEEHNKETGDVTIALLYKQKLLEAIEKQLIAQEEKAKAESSLEAYKIKYKKLVELFRDAELSEKAKIIVEYEKIAKEREELARQLKTALTELEQVKSRYNALVTPKPRK